MGQPRPIGQPHLLGLMGKLQEDHCRPPRGQKPAGLRQGEAQGRARIAPLVGEDFVQQPAGGREEGLFPLLPQCGGFGQHGALFDLRDPRPQSLHLFKFDAQHGEGSLPFFY